jgi:hypothetical protein
MTIRFYFIDGIWDRRTLRSDSRDPAEAADVNRLYAATDKGTIGAKFVVALNAPPAIESQEELGTPHEYLVAERVETSDGIMVRCQAVKEAEREPGVA